MEQIQKNNEGLWRTHLKIQNEITRFIDSKFLFSDSDFQAARSFLDIGTGYGLHIHDVSKEFPKKYYVGVDIEGLAIKSAKKEFSESSISFQHVDINIDRLEETFDFALARFLVQHLKSVRTFLEFVSNSLNPGGVLLIIEVFEQLKRFHPVLPTVKAIYSELRKQQLAKYTDEETIAEIPVIAKRFELLPKEETIVVGYAGLDFSKATLCSMYETNLKVIQAFYKINEDFDVALNEISSWSEAEDPLATIAFHILKLQKTPN